MSVKRFALLAREREDTEAMSKKPLPCPHLEIQQKYDVLSPFYVLSFLKRYLVQHCGISSITCPKKRWMLWEEVIGGYCTTQYDWKCVVAMNLSGNGINNLTMDIFFGGEGGRKRLPF